MRKTIGVLLGFTALAAGAATENLHFRAEAPVCSKAPTKPDAGPISYGERTTFRGAQHAVSFTLLTQFGGPRPSVPPTSVWLAEPPGIVATVYGPEHVTMYMRAGQFPDLQAGLEDLLPAISATATVEKVVEGHWTLLIQPDTDACGSNPAAIHTELYGTDVEVYSDTRSVDDLVAFANTLLPDYAK